MAGSTGTKTRAKPRKEAAHSDSIAGSQTLTYAGRGRKDYWTPYLFILPAIFLVFLVFVFPIGSGFETSLHEDTLLSVDRPFVGFENYRALFSGEEFRNALTVSLFFVGGTVVLGLTLSLSFAIVLNKTWFGRRFFRAMSLTPWLISGVAVATMWAFMFSSDSGTVQPLLRSVGIHVDTWLGSPQLAIVVLILANTWYIVPFGTLILLAGLQTVDGEQIDAAAVDGANAVQSFRHITVPAIAPQIGLTLVYFSFASWNAFDLILTATGGGPGRSTEVLSLLLYREAFGSLDFAVGAAIMVILLVINTAFSIFYLKVMPRAS